MKIYVDEMLKNISKWLRLFGIKNQYLKGMADKDIRKIVKEGILITSDKELAKAMKEKALFLDIKKSREEKLAEIIKKLKFEFEKEGTICTICNSPLIKVDKGKIRGKVFEKVYKNNEEFYYCEECKKYYWKGSHWKRINKVYAKVKELLKRDQSL